jgi:hypothetical protein
MGFRGGSRHFDCATLETFTGKVTEAKMVTEYAPFSMKKIMVEANGKKMIGHLGPAFYLDAQ